MMRMRWGDAADDGNLGEGRVDRKGPRGADLRDGCGELHIGACRDLDSGVPGPKERAG
jgi:hypothetical protein